MISAYWASFMVRPFPRLRGKRKGLRWLVSRYPGQPRPSKRIHNQRARKGVSLCRFFSFLKGGCLGVGAIRN